MRQAPSPHAARCELVAERLPLLAGKHIPAGEERERLLLHVEACPGCRAELEAWRDLVRAWPAPPMGATPPAARALAKVRAAEARGGLAGLWARFLPTRPTLRAAGGLLLLLLLLGGVRLLGQGEGSAPKVTGIAPAPDPVPVGEPAIPARSEVAQAARRGQPWPLGEPERGSGAAPAGDAAADPVRLVALAPARAAGPVQVSAPAAPPAAPPDSAPAAVQPDDEDVDAEEEDPAEVGADPRDGPPDLPTPPAPAATPEPIPAVILLAGRVSTAGGAPLPGADVQVWPQDPSGPAAILLDTDAEGRFHVELPAGDYRLYAEAEGHAGRWWDQAIHLSDGAPATDVDVRLEPLPGPIEASPPPDPSPEPTAVAVPWPGAPSGPEDPGREPRRGPAGSGDARR